MDVKQQSQLAADGRVTTERHMELTLLPHPRYGGAADGGVVTATLLTPSLSISSVPMVPGSRDRHHNRQRSGWMLNQPERVLIPLIHPGCPQTVFSESLRGVWTDRRSVTVVSPAGQFFYWPS